MSEVLFITCSKCKCKCRNNPYDINLMFGYKQKKHVFYKTCFKCREKRAGLSPECQICYNRFKLKTNLKCGHEFCRNCLKKWLDKNNEKMKKMLIKLYLVLCVV